MSTQRYPALDEADMVAAQRDLMARIREFSTASAAGPFPMLLRSPALGERFLALSSYLRFQSRVPEALAELAILIHARLGCDRYEWDLHVRRGIAAGIGVGIIEDMLAGRKPRELSTAQDTVYRFCLQLLQTRWVDDVTFKEAQDLLGEDGVVDLTVTLGMYSMLSKILVVAGVNVHRDSSMSLPTLVKPLPLA